MTFHSNLKRYVSQEVASNKFEKTLLEIMKLLIVHLFHLQIWRFFKAFAIFRGLWSKYDLEAKDEK
jgi:hypothetical protein